MGVHLRFRLRWMATVALIGAAAGVALFFVLRAMLSREIGTDPLAGLFALQTTQSILLSAIGLSVLFYILLLSVLNALDMIYLTYHVAWPIHQMEEFAAALGRDDLSVPLHQAPRDQLKDLTGAVEELRREIAGRVRSADAAMERIEGYWAELDAADLSKHDEKAAELLRGIEAELEGIG